MLPDGVRSWLLLRRSGLPTQSRTTLIGHLDGRYTMSRVTRRLRESFDDADLREIDQGRQARGGFGLEARDEAEDVVEEFFDVEDDPAHLVPEASDWNTQYWSDQDWSDLWDAWDAEPEPAAYWQGSDWYQYGSEWDTSESMWQQPSHMWDAVHEEVPTGALTPAGSTVGTEDYATSPLWRPP